MMEVSLTHPAMPCKLTPVYFKGRGVRIPRYPVTVIGKIPSKTAIDRYPVFVRKLVKTSFDKTGQLVEKAGGKIAHKPGDFGIWVS